MQSNELSVTQMLTHLKDGDEEAAQAIWEHFFSRVVSLARSKLATHAKREMDEEDIAMSVMKAMYFGVQEGRFRKLNDREDLWQILCMLTSRKSANAWRRQKSKGLVGESAISGPSTGDVNRYGLQHIVEAAPDSGYIDSLNQECRERLEALDERLRQVALLRLHGFSNQEIAQKIGRSHKSVERYLKTIRAEWSE